MAGLNLAAIGAGLGQFAKQYQEQKAQQERTQLLQMQLQQYRQKMADEQRQQSAADAAAGLALSGGGGGGAPVGQMGDLSQMANIPGASAPRMAGEGSGRGGWGPFAEPAIQAFKSGGASDAFIQAAMGQGLAEGGFKTNWNLGDSGTSGGHWQYHQGGELNPYMKFSQGQDYKSTPLQAQYLMKRAEEIQPGITKSNDPNAIMDVLGTQFERYQGAGPGQRRGYLADAQKAMAGGALQPRAAIPDAPGQPAGLAAVPDFAGRMGGAEGAAYAPPAMAPEGDDTGAGGGAPSDQTVGAGGYRYDIGSDGAKAAIGGNTPPVTSTPGGTNGIVPAGAPRGTQVAQAGPQTPTVQLPNGLNVPPPDAMDFGQIVRAIKKQHPEFDNRTLLRAAEIAQKDHLGPSYKQAFDRWKALWEQSQGQQRIDLTRSGQQETGRHNVVEEGQGQQRIRLTGQAQAETGRHNVASEALTGSAQTETRRHNIAGEKGAAARLQAQVGKTQQAQQLATTQMKTLADRARRLYQAVEENPNLVGVRGYAQRRIGGIGEQLGITQEDPAVADFKSQVSLLQAQLQKPLLGARYFSGKAQEQMAALVPALARLDNPTAVKSALRNLAEVLEGTAESTEAAGRGVTGDFEINDETARDYLRTHGIEPQQ